MFFMWENCTLGPKGSNLTENWTPDLLSVRWHCHWDILDKAILWWVIRYTLHYISLVWLQWVSYFKVRCRSGHLQCNADPCHFKVESAKYDKWALNSSRVTVVWKGHIVSSSSSTGRSACLLLVDSLSSVIWIPMQPLSSRTSVVDMHTDCVTQSELRSTSKENLTWRMWMHWVHFCLCTTQV